MRSPRPRHRLAQLRQFALSDEFPGRGHAQRQLGGQSRAGVGDPHREAVETAREPGEVRGDQNDDRDREDN